MRAGITLSYFSVSNSALASFRSGVEAVVEPIVDGGKQVVSAEPQVRFMQVIR